MAFHMIWINCPGPEPPKLIVARDVRSQPSACPPAPERLTRGKGIVMPGLHHSTFEVTRSEALRRGGSMLIVSKVQPSPIFPLSLLATFVVIWVALAIAPLYRLDWALENSLVLVAVSVLVMSYRHLRLSNAAYSMIFLFLVFHEIGAHYTYSKVPYEQWLSHLYIAVSPAHRNDYDRLVHFLYGLLITPAATELISKVSDPRGMWRWLLPISFIMSHSLLYELIEWWAAVMFGGDLGVAYLGTQGDPWDAQRDMFAATIGSVIAMASIYLHRLRVGIFFVV